MKTTDELWLEFFGTGWEYHKIPSKRDCFEAGFKAALKMTADKKTEKKTTYEIIKEWEDKFEAALPEQDKGGGESVGAMEWKGTAIVAHVRPEGVAYEGVEV